MSLDGNDIIALYDRHARELVSFFARRTGDPQLALDLLGDTFLAAFPARERCDADGAEQRAAWLYRIAANKPLDAAILLDARRPGQMLGPLPGASSVSGHPGVVNVMLGRLPGDLTARRVGSAWLVVEGGASLAQRLQVLGALRIVKLTVP